MSLEQLRSVVLRVDGASRVHLSDVATVTRTDGETMHLARYNGKRALFITASLKENQDVFKGFGRPFAVQSR